MIPRLYIRDQNDIVVSTLDEGDYFDDNLTRYLAGKASIFEFSIYKNADDYKQFSAGKKLSFRYEGEDFWMSIVNTDQDETKLTIMAVSLNLELNNEATGPYKASKPMSFAEYVNAMVNYEKTFEIGLNEVSEKRISNEWTGTDTNLSRLFSLATVFGAELEFVSELNPNGSLKRIVMNVYKEHSDTVQGVGTDRRSETFRFGKDIKTVRKTEDASGVYTAIRPHGTDGLTVKDIEKEIFDENGVLLYCTYKTARPGFSSPHIIYAPQSRDVFPSTLSNEDDRWIVKDTEEMDYKSAEALFGYGLGELKKNCIPQVEWEIEGYINGRIGDTIRVADSGYKPEIYLDARITEQTISFTKPSQNKFTFSNVKELQSQVSTDLLSKMEELIEANKVYTCTISSTNGVTFKNGEGSTVLTAIVRDSAVEVTDKFSIEWFKDGTFLDTGAEITVNASEVGEKSVYKFVAKKADETVAGMYEVTVTDMSDGKDGESGRGISGTPETVYGQSKLGTMPGTWSTTRPNVPAGEYLWTKTITKYTDNTESSVIIPTLMGPKGEQGVAGPPTGITESATIPTDPYVGMLWKNTGEEPSYIPNVTYRWNGSRWAIYTFVAENISASTLSAICANLGTVTAGTINGVNINGSVITNTFKNWETGIEFGSAGSGQYLGGSATLKGGRLEIQSNLCNKNGVPITPERRFFTTTGEEGFEYRINDSGGTLQYIQVNGSGFAVSDMSTEPPRSAILTVDDIIKLKNFNEKTKVIFDAGYDYNKMPYPRETQKYALGDITKIKWIIINWAMYNPSTGASQFAHEQTVLEYSSTSAAGSYRIVLPYDEKDGNSAAAMTIKRISFPFENGTTYLQGSAVNYGTFSKWWVMRKLIIVEG